MGVSERGEKKVGRRAFLPFVWSFDNVTVEYSGWPLVIIICIAIDVTKHFSVCWTIEAASAKVGRAAASLNFVVVLVIVRNCQVCLNKKKTTAYLLAWLKRLLAGLKVVAGIKSSGSSSGRFTQ